LCSTTAVRKGPGVWLCQILAHADFETLCNVVMPFVPGGLSSCLVAGVLVLCPVPLRPSKMCRAKCGRTAQQHVRPMGHISTGNMLCVNSAQARHSCACTGSFLPFVTVRHRTLSILYPLMQGSTQASHQCQPNVLWRAPSAVKVPTCNNQVFERIDPWLQVGAKVPRPYFCWRQAWPQAA
jgi:hypothetical protein